MVSSSGTLKKPIERFNGYYDFLSNGAGPPVEFEGLTYPKISWAYAGAMTDCSQGVSMLRSAIATAASFARASDLAAHARRRTDWNDVRDGILADLLAQKFDSDAHPNYREMLLATGSRLLLNGRRTLARSTGGYLACRTHNGRIVSGRNALGVALMELRGRLQARQAAEDYRED